MESLFISNIVMRVDLKWNFAVSESISVASRLQRINSPSLNKVANLDPSTVNFASVKVQPSLEKSDLSLEMDWL